MTLSPIKIVLCELVDQPDLNLQKGSARKGQEVPQKAWSVHKCILKYVFKVFLFVFLNGFIRCISVKKLTLNLEFGILSLHQTGKFTHSI